MSRQGRNATVLASANNGAFGDYSGYEDAEDDMDEGIHNNSSLYLRPEVSYCFHTVPCCGTQSLKLFSYLESGNG